MSKKDPEMTANDVIDVLQLFNENLIELHIDGGWGVDALLWEQTRKHLDLDIAVQHKDVDKIRALLEARGYKEMPGNDSWECNFVMGDEMGHLIDIHSYTLDEQGRNIYGLAYPPDSLTGKGWVNGQPVQCISPEWMVRFHSGYPLDEDDYRDVKALCLRFDIPLPAEYTGFEKKGSISPEVKALIAHFKLERLPVEGTLFTNTYRSNQNFENGNPPGSAMIGLFCDEPRSVTLFHRLPVDEIWHFYAGDALRLILLYPNGSSRDVIMGSEPLKGHQVQFVVPAGVWQAGHMLDGGNYALFGCTMAPGFIGSMFEGGTREILMKNYPERAEDISWLGCENTETSMPEDFAK
jgi:predicted cupin superfamily sugar epimerase